jgi:hypothetical protein
MPGCRLTSVQVASVVRSAKPMPSDPGSNDATGATDPLTDAQARELLPTLEQRRSAIDQTMWQAPALSITAQAFLFAVALNPDTVEYGRITVLVVGLAAVLAALFLLLKQRYLEELHSELIIECQRLLGGVPPYRRYLEARKPERPRGRTRRERTWRRLQESQHFQEVESFYVWVGALSAFAAADVYLLIKTVG